VVAGGGYTLMSEAVYLHKPMLAEPIAGQFEQVLNALYLEKLGYGMYAKSLEGDVLPRFLERLPECQKALEGYTQDGNAELFNSLDEQLMLALVKKGKWDEVTES
jgi:UDP-N-acetylglucosamine:LPS N-acetylglucosamine transferase